MEMTQTMRFTIGADAHGTDGRCGRISRVVIDPLAEAVTHLVVEPTRDRGISRLVPLDLLDPSADGIRLRCTTSQFAMLDPAEEARFLPGSSGYSGYPPDDAMSWPYYSAGARMGSMAVGGMARGGIPLGGLEASTGNVASSVVTDTLPEGEVGLRRGEPVHATDGDIGNVQGLVISAGDRHITHVLLREGHLFGRKQVAIPIGSITAVTDGIRVGLTRQQVQNLPPVHLDRPIT
jgi:sporulation protein YlmC with PRC-barrel domain